MEATVVTELIVRERVLEYSWKLRWPLFISPCYEAVLCLVVLRSSIVSLALAV
jgi:hypothetical protein